MTELLRPGGYSPETAYTRVTRSDLGESLARTFQATRQVLDERVVRNAEGAIQETIDEATQADPEASLAALPDFIGSEDPAARALQHDLYRAEIARKRGGAQAYAKAQMAVKQRLAELVANNPRLRGQLITAANQVVSVSPAMEAARLASQGRASDPSIEMYDRTVAHGYENLGIPPNIRPTDPRWTEMYLKREADRQEAIRYDNTMEALSRDKNLSAMEAEVLYTEQMLAPTGNAALARREFLGQVSAVAENARAIARGFDVDPNNQAELEVAKQEINAQIATHIASLRENYQTFFALNQDSDPAKRSQQLLDAEIQFYTDLQNVVNSDDFDALSVLKAQEELYIFDLKNRNPKFRKFSAMVDAIGADNYKILMDSLGGADVLLQQRLSGYGIEAVNQLYDNVTAEQSMADMYGYGGQGSPTSDPERLRRELADSAAKSRPNRRNGLNTTKNMLRVANTASANLRTINEFSSPEAVAMPLNNLTTAFDQFNLNDIEDPKVHQFVWTALSDDTLIEAAGTAVRTPEGRAAVAALANSAEDYMNEHIAPTTEARHAPIRSILTRPFASGGVQVPVLDLLVHDEGALRDRGILRYTVNEARIRELWAGDPPSAFIARKAAQKAATEAADLITLHVNALRNLDYLRHPVGEPLSFEAALAENQYDQYLF